LGLIHDKFLLWRAKFLIFTDIVLGLKVLFEEAADTNIFMDMAPLPGLFLMPYS
jgi:hypothetical protein